MLTSFIVLVGLVYTLIVLVDPYQNIPFSLPLDRAPISNNQRFAYPSLARDPQFDSAIIGSSTVRLLNPENLDKLTGARFANLAMNSATAYEQMRMHELFLRHHPRAKYVIIGIDDSWCKREASYERYTFRDFPEWMFDDNPWNDMLYMFNDKALENTVRMIEYINGQRQAKYETNGFRDFTVDFGASAIGAVRARLYPNGLMQVRRAPDIVPLRAHPDWQFASHDLLDRVFGSMASSTRAVALFAPMHGQYLLRAETLYRECKARILELAERHQIEVMDYMIDSSITRIDENYWDPLHYTSRVAHSIESDIARHLNGEDQLNERYINH